MSEREHAEQQRLADELRQRRQNVDVRIELPLPVDISATLISIIGLTWPGTVIKNGGAGSLLLQIPAAERHKNAKRAAEYAKVKSTSTPRWTWTSPNWIPTAQASVCRNIWPPTTPPWPA